LGEVNGCDRPPGCGVKKSAANPALLLEECNETIWHGDKSLRKNIS